jgi:hypothetical protein
VIRLGAAVVNALMAHRERQSIEISSASSLWKDLRLVFASTIGNPKEPTSGLENR